MQMVLTFAGEGIGNQTTTHLGYLSVCGAARAHAERGMSKSWSNRGAAGADNATPTVDAWPGGEEHPS